MTTPQRIEQILRKYENDHKSKIYSYHESTRKELKKDVEAVRSELNALLLAVQDEQKEKTTNKIVKELEEERKKMVERFQESDISNGIISGIKTAREIVKEVKNDSPYSYNPNKENA